MENIDEKEPLEQEGYTPRPEWQVWSARAALVIFILLVILQIVNITRGGL